MKLVTGQINKVHANMKVIVLDKMDADVYWKTQLLCSVRPLVPNPVMHWVTYQRIPISYLYEANPDPQPTSKEYTSSLHERGLSLLAAIDVTDLFKDIR